MPYVTSGQRSMLKNCEKDAENAGELNFLFTWLALRYWGQNGQNYQAFNDVLGAMEGAKLELYRRHVAPYEDKKIEQNGDIKVEIDTL
jgi:hypothetical protein